MIQLALELKLTEVITSLWLIWFTLSKEKHTFMASVEMVSVFKPRGGGSSQGKTSVELLPFLFAETEIEVKWLGREWVQNKTNLILKDWLTLMVFYIVQYHEGYFPDYDSLGATNISRSCPGQGGAVGRTSFHAPKVCRFSFHSGHMPRFGTQSVYHTHISVSLPLSIPLSLKID